MEGEGNEKGYLGEWKRVGKKAKIFLSGWRS